MTAFNLTPRGLYVGLDPDGRLLDNLLRQSGVAVVPQRPGDLPDERLTRRVEALRRSGCAVVILPSAEGTALAWWLQQPGAVSLTEVVA